MASKKKKAESYLIKLIFILLKYGPFLIIFFFLLNKHKIQMTRTDLFSLYN